jgi:ABC-type transport system involved in cytochrome bd biosynthesis fused ATPase/permease subunit
LKKGKIFLFDEATSGLDNKNEINIFENIKKEFKEGVIVLITHRLNNLVDY